MKVNFHSFTMGDVDDVDIYVAQPIHEWQQTTQGKWAMEHARDLRYYISPDISRFGHLVCIQGDIDEGPELTEYLLRYGKI